VAHARVFRAEERCGFTTQTSQAAGAVQIALGMGQNRKIQKKTVSFKRQFKKRSFFEHAFLGDRR
jgi:hypothetical protein